MATDNISQYVHQFRSIYSRGWGLPTGIDLVYDPEGPQLPNEILSMVAQTATIDFKLMDCLRLRLVSRHWNKEIMHQLFNRFRIRGLIREDLRGRYDSIDRPTVHRYWYAFLSAAHVPKEFFCHLRTFVLEPNEPSSVNSFTQHINNIHRNLSQAVESLIADIPVHNRNSREQTIITLCQVVYALLGHDIAWMSIHPLGFHKPLRQYDGPFINRFSAKLWVLLATAYLGDFDKLQLLLHRVKDDDDTRHSNDWVIVRDEDEESSQYDMRNWDLALAACLTIAVSQDSIELAECVFRQIPAISPGNLIYVQFQEKGLLEIATMNCSVSMLKCLLEHGWSFPSPRLLSMTSLEAQEYCSIMLIIASVSQFCRGRDETFRYLLESTQSWSSKTYVQFVLMWAAKRDDIELAEQLRIALSRVPALRKQRRLDQQCFAQIHPLTLAVYHGNFNFARYLMEHQKELHLWELKFAHSWRNTPRRTNLIRILNAGVHQDLQAVTDIKELCQMEVGWLIKRLINQHEKSTNLDQHLKYDPNLSGLFEFVGLQDPITLCHQTNFTMGQLAVCLSICERDGIWAGELIAFKGIRLALPPNIRPFMNIPLDHISIGTPELMLPVIAENGTSYEDVKLLCAYFYSIFGFPIVDGESCDEE